MTHTKPDRIPEGRAFRTWDEQVAALKDVLSYLRTVGYSCRVRVPEFYDPPEGKYIFVTNQDWARFEKNSKVALDWEGNPVEIRNALKLRHIRICGNESMDPGYKVTIDLWEVD